MFGSVEGWRAKGGGVGEGVEEESSKASHARHGGAAVAASTAVASTRLLRVVSIFYLNVCALV